MARKRAADIHELLESDMERIEAWGRQHTDRYAGQWFDTERPDPHARRMHVMCVAVVHDPRRVEDELREMLDHPQRLRVFVARRTYAELCDICDEIVAEYMSADRTPAPEVEGSRVTVAGVDVQHNKVTVGISTHDDRLREQILSRWGGDVVDIQQMTVRPVVLTSWARSVE